MCRSRSLSPVCRASGDVCIRNSSTDPTYLRLGVGALGGERSGITKLCCKFVGCAPTEHPWSNKRSRERERGKGGREAGRQAGIN